jgi:tripartite-type tricarboxylate transporter receptor subunit TctC
MSQRDSKLIAPAAKARRQFVLGSASLAGSAALGSGPAWAQAQAYPTKPIRFVIPWPAGGITDTAGRAFANLLSKRLNSTVVVENKAGATASIGATLVAQSAPDGYTLLLGTSETHGINVHTFQKLAYDPGRDFVSIAPFAINPFSLVTRPDFPANSIAELVALAKAQPGRITYSSAGLGAATQLTMEIFRTQAGIELLHVPFQGEAPAVTALMAGQTDIQILSVGRATQLSKAGKVKVLAVTMPERYFGLKDIPTLKEAGYGQANIANWYGLIAPARTPAAIIERLHAETQAIVRDPDTVAAFRAMGLEIAAQVSQADFQRATLAEPERWAQVIRSGNIRQQP